MRLFVVNVGVNSRHAARRGTRSPVFPDGSFEFLPIPESAAFAGCPGIPTYRDLRSWTGRVANLAALVPERERAHRVHADPEFETFTYGDIPSPRAANLTTAVRGDQVWFLARLWSHDGARWTGTSDFHFIGFFELQANIPVPAGTGPDDLPTDVRKRIRRNAHYARLKCGHREAFRVLVGSRTGSCRFAHAMRITPEVAGLIYGGRYHPGDGTFRRGRTVLRSLNGKVRRFDTFGSVTRSIQAFLDSAKPEDREHLKMLSRLAIQCGTPR